MFGRTDYLFAVCIALSICMALIPLLVRAAPRFGLLDEPDPRKVHSVPVPRVGGLAIIAGSVVAILLWVPLDRLTQSYLLAAAVLVVFGVWDDIKEVGHYRKFVGQVIAVLIVVLYGELYITRLPFGWETVPAAFGIPFTVFAMVGMINAINHSDGLDGLAGGESVLSLAAIAYLAYLAEAGGTTMIAVALVGGILGFLRFNTFPARIFMGDAGSQVLGLTLGFLAVVLTQQANPALSAAIPALLLGLPISDILGVLFLRIRGGMNWFRASKNHVHHRLLALGLEHHQSVMVIYSVQALLVVLAVVLRYESDALVTGVYFAVIFCVFAGLTLAERRGWRAHVNGGSRSLWNAIGRLKYDTRLKSWSMVALKWLVPGFMVAVCATVGEVPYDMGLVAVVLLAVLALDLAFGAAGASIIVRGIVYVAVVFTVYLGTVFTPDVFIGRKEMAIAYFLALSLAIVANIRFGEQDTFKVTPLDYLVLCTLIGAFLVDDNRFFFRDAGLMMIQAVLLVYGCELIVSRVKGRLTALNVATAVSLGLISLKGLSN